MPHPLHSITTSAHGVLSPWPRAQPPSPTIHSALPPTYRAAQRTLPAASAHSRPLSTASLLRETQRIPPSPPPPPSHRTLSKASNMQASTQRITSSNLQQIERNLEHLQYALYTLSLPPAHSARSSWPLNTENTQPSAYKAAQCIAPALSAHKTQLRSPTKHTSYTLHYLEHMERCLNGIQHTEHNLQHLQHTLHHFHHLNKRSTTSIT